MQLCVLGAPGKQLASHKKHLHKLYCLYCKRESHPAQWYCNLRLTEIRSKRALMWHMCSCVKTGRT